MPNRLFTAPDGAQWVAFPNAFGGGSLTSPPSNPQYDQAMLVFESVRGKERRTVWVDWPVDLESIDVEQLQTWLATATPAALRP